MKLALPIKISLFLLLATSLALLGAPSKAEVGLLLGTDGNVMGGAGQYPDGRKTAVVLWNLRTNELLGRYGTELWHHTCADLSGDGNLLAIAGQISDPQGAQIPRRASSGSATGFANGLDDAFRMQSPALYVWDLAANKIVLKLDCGTVNINAVKFSPDGKALAAAKKDHTIVTWEVPSGKLSKRFVGAEQEVSCLTFSSDGKSLFSREAGQQKSVVRRWSLESGKQLNSFDVDVPLALANPATSMKTSVDDKLIAVGNVFSTLKIIDPVSGKETKSFDRSAAFAFSPDGKVLALADENGKVHLRSLETDRNVSSLAGHSDLPSPYNRVVLVDFCQKGLNLITASNDGTFRVWDLASGKQLSTFQSVPSRIADTAFDTTGKVLATGSNRGELQLFDVTSGKKLKQIQVPEESAQILLPASKDIIVTRGEKSVQLYSIKTGDLSTKLPAIRPTSMDGSSDGEQIAVGLSNGKTEIYDLNGKLLSQLISESAKPISCVRFSSDGKLIATGSQDCKVRLWSLPESKLLNTIASHNRNINAVEFCTGGKQLISADANGNLKLSDVTSGQLLTSFKLPQGNCCSLATTRDGTRFAASSYNLGAPNFTTIWTLPLSVESPKGFQIPTQMDLCPGLQFSPDGQSIVGGSSFGKIQIWNAKTGQKSTISNE
ncbi:MAG: WD40 repeat domain-containing protein [Candidatus Melainabacteria bacterium]|nr:WD40 repeat domain-containing protein [Candidatus Melainabacteria bacterium]